MSEMGFDDRTSLFYDIRHHRLLIVGHGLTLDHADRTFRAGADAGPEPVAEKIAHEPGLPVDELERSLRAVRDALAATGAFLSIDADDLPFHAPALPVGSLLIVVVSFWYAGYE